MKYDAIIKQLDGTEFPDRDLDIAIGSLWPEPRRFNLSAQVLRNGKNVCPFFTRNIEEVISLCKVVLVGWEMNIGIDFQTNTSRAMFYSSRKGVGSTGNGTSETNEAISLLIAMFKALNYMEEAKQC